MATDFTTGLALIKDVFTNTTVFGQLWIIPMLVVILTLVIITRDIKQWKIMALPVMIAWHIIGLKQSMPFFILAVFFFVIELLSTETAGNLLDVAIQHATGGKVNLGETKHKVAMNWGIGKATKMERAIEKMKTGIKVKAKKEKIKQKAITKELHTSLEAGNILRKAGIKDVSPETKAHAIRKKKKKTFNPEENWTPSKPYPTYKSWMERNKL